MNSEYIRFQRSEKKSIQKSFLTSQMMLLDSLKKHANYKKLRTEELLLKIALKTKIEHLNNNIKAIEKHMPKTTISPKNMSALAETRRSLSLEEEIEMIKRKIAALSQ